MLRAMWLAVVVGICLSDLSQAQESYGALVYADQSMQPGCSYGQSTPQGAMKAAISDVGHGNAKELFCGQNRYVAFARGDGSAYGFGYDASRVTAVKRAIVGCHCENAHIVLLFHTETGLVSIDGGKPAQTKSPNTPDKQIHAEQPPFELCLVNETDAALVPYPRVRGSDGHLARVAEPDNRLESGQSGNVDTSDFEMSFYGPTSKVWVLLRKFPRDLNVHVDVNSYLLPPDQEVKSRTPNITRLGRHTVPMESQAPVGVLITEDWGVQPFELESGSRSSADSTTQTRSEVWLVNRTNAALIPYPVRKADGRHRRAADPENTIQPGQTVRIDDLSPFNQIFCDPVSKKSLFISIGRLVPEMDVIVYRSTEPPSFQGKRLDLQQLGSDRFAMSLTTPNRLILTPELQIRQAEVQTPEPMELWLVNETTARLLRYDRGWRVDRENAAAAGETVRVKWDGAFAAYYDPESRKMLTFKAGQQEGPLTVDADQCEKPPEEWEDKNAPMTTRLRQRQLTVDLAAANAVLVAEDWTVQLLESETADPSE